MKLIKALLIVFVVVSVGLYVARDALLRKAVIRPLTAAWHGAVDVGSVESDFWQRRLVLRDITLHNPPGFIDQAALDVRELRIHYNWTALLGRTVHLSEVVLDIRKASLETSPGGQVNLMPAASAAPTGTVPQPSSTSSKPAPAGKPATAQAEPDRARNLLIDNLTLRLDEVEVLDRSRGGGHRPRSYRINWEGSFQKVEDFETVGQAMAMDLALVVAPTLLREVLQEIELPPDVSLDELETIGRQLDADTKDVQRELRQQFRELRRQLEP
jgi:uncharacterized protein involved in outer membrane biogenesis